jgi:hypothetical protein
VLFRSIDVVAELRKGRFPDDAAHYFWIVLFNQVDKHLPYVNVMRPLLCLRRVWGVSANNIYACPSCYIDLIGLIVLPPPVLKVSSEFGEPLVTRCGVTGFPMKLGWRNLNERMSEHAMAFYKIPIAKRGQLFLDKIAIVSEPSSSDLLKREHANAST